MQRLTFIYLASYLLVGGLGLLLAPDLTLRLLLSNGTYGDVMPRLAGMFMLALGGVILQFVRGHDYRHYGYAIVARIFIVVALTTLYFRARDPVVHRAGCHRPGWPTPVYLRCCSDGPTGLGLRPAVEAQVVRWRVRERNRGG